MTFDGRYLLAAGLLALASLPAAAQDGAVPGSAEPPGYHFASPPSAQANRVYSVNAATGELSACQFERPEGSLVGVTRCFAKDGSAGPQQAGRYQLVPTSYSGETGVFRVNIDTGEMSICYVRDMPKSGGGTEAAVVCTAPAK